MDLGKTTALIKFQEGFRQYAYDDKTGAPPVETGVLTIGFGRNLISRGITLDEANILLSNDIQYFIQKLQAYFTPFAKLDDVRQAVLISMAFNIGINGLLKFKDMLNYLSKGQFDNARNAMLNSDWAKQVPSRANQLSSMMSTGNWPIIE
jgi:lysozyme